MKSTQFLQSAIVICAAAASLPAAAETTVTGIVDKVYVSSSTLQDFRISVHVTPTSGSFSAVCAAGGWYSGERENLQLKKSWLATALLARSTQAPVTIIGKGTCDDYNIESLSTIAY
ncbi:hypothetical protein [Rhizobacter sp. OV335]|uniref:hypothetical protein n=1 Tax=Rhizobacter sp. OV335 TaxID=1500264 RepID=UPI00091B52EF|nr:hypothetical protein [Rhizobacter sp. OV335]SHM97937.1 hypothetical protein SAMN02787076_02799 [Rhizobacter sp. OV335]